MNVGKLLSAAAVCFVVVFLISLLESKDDPTRVIPRALQEEEEEPFPTFPQTHVLAFTPVVSGTNFALATASPFGPYYDDDVRPPYNEFTLQALWESGEPHKQAAAKVAHDWILQHQEEIFRTIFLLEYAEPKIQQAVELVRIESAQIKGIEGDEKTTTTTFHSTMRIVVREKQAGSAHAREIRERLRDNVQSGGDTYECNDWGDVKDPLTGAKIRVSFSNMPVEWDPPLPPKQCRQPPEAATSLFPRLPYLFQRPPPPRTNHLEVKKTKETKQRMKLQHSAVRSIVTKYGEGPIQVVWEVVVDGTPNQITIVLWHDAPYAAWTWLEQISNRQWDGAQLFLENNHRVMGVETIHARNGRLEFLERSHQGHEAWTVGLSSTLQVFINLQDNTVIHKDAVCIGRVVEGFDVLHKIAENMLQRRGQAFTIQKVQASHYNNGDHENKRMMQ